MAGRLSPFSSIFVRGVRMTVSAGQIKRGSRLSRDHFDSVPAKAGDRRLPLIQRTSASRATRLQQPGEGAAFGAGRTR